MAALVGVLEEHGYQPLVSDGDVRLGNCPFQAVVADHRDTVCAMNLWLLEGVVAGVGSTGLRAAVDRQAGVCCVVLRAEVGRRAG